MNPESKSESCFSSAQKKLVSRDHRMTGPRKAVLECLSLEQRPMTVKELHLGLGGYECDLATIYRSIRLLEKVGSVERFDFGDGVSRYEIVVPEREGHHHHLICRTCSKVVGLETCLIDGLQKGLAEKTGFKALSHKLAFFGTCPDCQV